MTLGEFTGIREPLRAPGFYDEPRSPVQPSRGPPKNILPGNYNQYNLGLFEEVNGGIEPGYDSPFSSMANELVWLLPID
jgi:hypothetical protein